MEVLYPRCAGLDVHAGSVTACVRVAAGSEVTYHHHTVPTTTPGLLALDEWLTDHGCTHVAMEATGVYWKNHEGVALTDAGCKRASLWPCVRARS